MDADGLSPEQAAIFWEVKEWYPHASRAVLIRRIGEGLEALIAACDAGQIPQDDVSDEEIASDIEQALQLSMNPEEQQLPQLQPQNLQLVRVMHVGEAAVPAAAGAAAATAAAPLQRTFEQALAAASSSRKPAATAAAPAAVVVPQCSICRRAVQPAARCHWPINPLAALGGDASNEGEDPRAHACCARCIKEHYLFKRVQVTSRVAIACLKLGCGREIHQDRLVSEAQLAPALAHWLLGNTDITVGNARFANTVRELKRKREEEPELADKERERLLVIIDHMDHDKFTYLVDLLPSVELTWLLENIDVGSVEAILDRKETDDTVPKRRRRRLDKKGVTHLVEDRLRLQTTFDCAICFEEVPRALGVPCVHMEGGGGAGGDAPPLLQQQHLFCGTCVRGHAAAAVELEAIVRAGLGLRCMQPGCGGVLIYAHIEPLLSGRARLLLEEKIAAAALKAAAVNVERCQRCPFAAIVELPISEQQTFACRRCGFEFCRNCNREWSARHANKTCEELNPEFIRRKVENALSDGAVGVLQRCPSCNVAFEKNGGCNNMHCRCGYSFPYAGQRVLSEEQRAAIIRQHVAEEGGDEAVVEELNKIK